MVPELQTGLPAWSEPSRPTGVEAEHARLRRQVTGLPLALIEWDGDQRVVGFSHRAEELFGFSSEEVLGKRFDEIPWVEEEDWPKARAEAQEMASTGKPAAVTVVRNRRKDGTTIHCEWYTSAQHDAAGRLVSLLSLVLDVTDRVHALEALRASEARARAVMENVRDQLVVLEPVRSPTGQIVDWIYVYANAAALELLGRGPEVVGQKVGEVMGEGFLALRGPALVAVLESGEPHRIEATHKDRTLLVTVFRIEGPRLVSASVDITDRKRTEARAASLARFPEENPDPVLRLARDATVLYANDAGLRAFAVAVGQPAPGLLAELAARAGRTGTRVKEELELGGATHSAVFAPVGEEVNIYAQDVSARKRVEEALRAELLHRERREAHRALLDEIAQDFARLSGEDEITAAIGRRLTAHLDVSVCILAELAGEQATLRTAFARTGATPLPAALRIAEYVSEELTAEARFGRTVVIGDVRNDARVDAARAEALGLRTAVIVPVLRDGVWRYSFAVGAPEARQWREDEIHLLQDAAARLFPRVERARIEEELRHSNAELRAVRSRLEEADRRKDDFLAVLSHELRNPLAPIRNGLQLLERSPTGEVARRALDVLRRQTDHLVRLVNDLLDVTRITHGKIDLRMARVDGRELVHRTFADAGAEFEQRGVDLLLLCRTGEPLWVEVDEARLGQMITNLLHNALKFTPPGGRVQLCPQRTGGCCEIRVRDTGIGIDGADLQRIFEPFVQVERTRRTHGGVGIGLALVRELAELQGGSVHAESGGIGAGAEFVIRLPLASAPQDVARHSPMVHYTRPLSIVVIDDNEDVALTLADLLGLLGHSVVTARSGAAGLQAITARDPDLLLCDVGLPDMSGYDVIRAVRARAREHSPFAVALTGYAQPHDRELAAGAGFDAHLGKPATVEELEEILARVGRELPEVGRSPSA